MDDSQTNDAPSVSSFSTPPRLRGSGSSYSKELERLGTQLAADAGNAAQVSSDSVMDGDGVEFLVHRILGPAVDVLDAIGWSTRDDLPKLNEASARR